MTGDRQLAVVELLGALAYGQLRAFEMTAHAIRVAPDASVGHRLAGFAVREHEAYVRLRDALARRTDLSEAVMDRQKPRFDDYFDAVELDDWLAASLFFAVGLPIAADFVREIAPTLDDETAGVLVAALADRGPFEEFALEQVRAAIAGSDEHHDRARHLSADVLGRALTGFQGALTDTDALKVLFREAAIAQGESAEAVVKRVAITIMTGHRRRMHALGLEDLE